jgi:hypothetical protein
LRAAAAALAGPLVVNAPDTGPTIDARSTGYFPAVNAQNDGDGPGLYVKGGQYDVAVLVDSNTGGNAVAINNPAGSGVYVFTGGTDELEYGLAVQSTGGNALYVQGGANTARLRQSRSDGSTTSALIVELQDGVTLLNALRVATNVASSGETALIVWHDGTESRVKVGPAGSGPGGAGRALYVD